MGCIVCHQLWQGVLSIRYWPVVQELIMVGSGLGHVYHIGWVGCVWVGGAGWLHSCWALGDITAIICIFVRRWVCIAILSCIVVVWRMV